MDLPLRADRQNQEPEHIFSFFFSLVASVFLFAVCLPTLLLEIVALHKRCLFKVLENIAIVEPKVQVTCIVPRGEQQDQGQGQWEALTTCSLIC